MVKSYDTCWAMENEFDILRKVGRIINTPMPLGVSEEHHCALLTEYIKGDSLEKLIASGSNLYNGLTVVAFTLRMLHDATSCSYAKDLEFSFFHHVIGRLNSDWPIKQKYARLLGDWWYSRLLDTSRGCRVHNDATPGNYIFQGDRLYALDFESSVERAHPAHDLGIIAAGLKHYYALHFYNCISNDTKSVDYSIMARYLNIIRIDYIMLRSKFSIG